MPRELLLSAVLISLPSIRAADETVDSKYERLLAGLKGGDVTIDFAALRESFASTPAYNPFGSGEFELRNKMFSHFENERCAEALGAANDILAKAYINGDAHLVAGICHERLGNTKESTYHRAIVRGLFESICAETDGRSPEKPCRVIALDEQRFYLLLAGLESQGQSLMDCATGPCDRIDVKSRKSGETFGMYFDISIQQAHIEQLLEEGRESE